MPAAFTGSDIRIREDSDEWAHVAYGFATAGWNDPDQYPLLLIQTMLGNWDKDVSSPHSKHSRSGLISKAADGLASKVMAFNTQYSDTGLFGVYFVAHPTTTDEMMNAASAELVRFCYEVDVAALEEAKNQLKIALLGHLDGSRPIVEDIGRQLLTYGRRVHPTEVLARVDAVDVAAIKNAATRFFLDRDHALAAMGPIYELPDYDWIRRKSYFLRK